MAQQFNIFIKTPDNQQFNLRGPITFSQLQQTLISQKYQIKDIELLCNLNNIKSFIQNAQDWDKITEQCQCQMNQSIIIEIQEIGGLERKEYLWDEDNRDFENQQSKQKQTEQKVIFNSGNYKKEEKQHNFNQIDFEQYEHFEFPQCQKNFSLGDPQRIQQISQQKVIQQQQNQIEFPYQQINQERQNQQPEQINKQNFQQQNYQQQQFSQSQKIYSPYQQQNLENKQINDQILDLKQKAKNKIQTIQKILLENYNAKPKQNFDQAQFQSEQQLQQQIQQQIQNITDEIQQQMIKAPEELSFQKGIGYSVFQQINQNFSRSIPAPVSQIQYENDPEIDIKLNQQNNSVFQPNQIVDLEITIKNIGTIQFPPGLVLTSLANLNQFEQVQQLYPGQNQVLKERIKIQNNQGEHKMIYQVLRNNKILSSCTFTYQIEKRDLVTSQKYNQSIHSPQIPQNNDFQYQQHPSQNDPYYLQSLAQKHNMDQNEYQMLLNLYQLNLTQNVDDLAKKIKLYKDEGIVLDNLMSATKQN